jgi:hypothetical protein
MEYNVKQYCCEDISLIENYAEAVADTTQVWACHHRDEIRVLPSGMVAIRSQKELQENGRYFNCPANELIFLTRSEHSRLHIQYMSYEVTPEIIAKRAAANKGRKRTEEQKQRMSQAKLDKKLKYTTEQKHNLSESHNKLSKGFYKAFLDHFGLKSTMENRRLYSTEYQFFRKNGKCRWEVENV